MTDINLRPWRKYRRDKIKKEYTQKLIVLGLLSVGILMGVFQYYTNAIKIQQTRNAYLTSVNKEMDEKITEIEILKKQKADILNRMTIINALQGDRKLTVKILDSLNLLTPKGVNLTLLSRTDNKFKFEGVTGINDDISEFLASLQASDFFEAPKLGKINLVIDDKSKKIPSYINTDKNKFFITATQKEQ